MSLRALKKRDSQFTQSNTSTARTTLFKKATAASITTPNKRALPKTLLENKLNAQKLGNQRHLLGRSTHSNPDVSCNYIERQWAIEANNLLRSKSEGNVSSSVALESKSSPSLLNAANAKSEVCLQSISSHNYDAPTTTMLGGARSHRDLTQSSYAATGSNELDNFRQPRRMSECSLSYSQASAPYSMFSSQMTLSSSAAATAPVDPNAVLRVPIVGYEVMEERARFTVYKLRVENPATNYSWLVLRRYTDFVRLNTKLKQAFPHITLLLPRKKLFGDNFNAVFLDNRVQGLQIFVNSVMAKEDLRKCKLVREFFCLDEPPSYSDSMEECRAIFEAQEETITHLKLQIQNKNDLILSLQQKLREAMKSVNQNCPHCNPTEQ